MACSNATNGWKTGSCNGPVPDFRGSFWGVVGNRITRMSDSVHENGELGLHDPPFYPYPNRRAHPRLSVELPNLTDSDGVERECFGAACTKIANDAAAQTSASATTTFTLWCWCHYVPVGEQNLDNAMAAFATVSCGSYKVTDPDQEQAGLGTPTVWLIEDEVWDDREKLDYDTHRYKCFVGPDHVGWLDRNYDIISGASTRQLKVTWYAKSSATLVTKIVDDPLNEPGVVGSEVYKFREPLSQSFPYSLVYRGDVP